MAKKSRINKTAVIVSFLLNPLIMVFLQILLIHRVYNISLESIFLTTSAFIVPVIGYILFAVVITKRADYEFTNKESRFPVLVIALLGLIISIAISLQINSVLTEYLLKFLVIMLILSILTYYWKVSFHATFFGLTVLYFASLVSSVLLLLYILLPLLFWARMELKKHTQLQLIIGSLIPLIAVL
ncbi:hypothetical protein H3C67_03990 [Candidatus Dojkabacteria bacterium]|uniref:Phosphatase PAP2 family protein n=1 Tax=Candidatus Dojkabacteria bacterium TaxID=2099670 RepID=A0A952AHK1_9BACT|nr:hypothetical protein [Candidatus Dojkabacteria bacterium]